MQVSSKEADDVSALATVQSECTTLAAANANTTQRSWGPTGSGASYVSLLHLCQEPPLLLHLSLITKPPGMSEQRAGFRVPAARSTHRTDMGKHGHHATKRHRTVTFWNTGND